MKLLKIEDDRGHYLDLQGKFVPIDKITKEDLFRLAELTLTEDVGFDQFNSEAIKNQAHQILYKSICEKLESLSQRRQEFIDESKRLYLVEYDRYREKSLQQTNPPLA